MKIKSSHLGLGVLFMIATLLFARVYHQQRVDSSLPLVAIANYGPHASLLATVEGIKAGLAQAGFVEHQTVRYAQSDVGFDPALIPQMVMQLTSQKPRVMVVMTTPVAQFAKGAVKTIPLIYSVVTDPVLAGLIPAANQPAKNMTGSSDQQDLGVFLVFAKQLLPHAKRIGVLYATSEPNDKALVTMLRVAAKKADMQVVAVAVDQARDVPMAMQQFKHQVDFIYVGTSGPIQPTLPVIASYAKQFGIPVFNVEEEAVKKGLALASFGVSYFQTGVSTGQLVAKVLKGVPVAKLQPISPSLSAYHGFISQHQAQALHVTIPSTLGPAMTVVP